MSAFNYITFSGTCVYCKENTQIEVQTHMAASFNGDDQGRFCLFHYNLGETMRWWPANHPEFDQWIDFRAHPTENNTYLEDCYGACKNCDQELIAIIEFKNLTPIALREIRTDEL